MERMKAIPLEEISEGYYWARYEGPNSYTRELWGVGCWHFVWVEGQYPFYRIRMYQRDGISGDMNIGLAQGRNEVLLFYKKLEDPPDVGFDSDSRDYARHLLGKIRSEGEAGEDEGG